jgi:transposase
VGESITFVGLDVHKATIAVCVAEGGRDGEVRFVGEIPHEPAALDKLVARLGRGGQTLRFAYEAGPCGYGVYRHLRDRGHDCVAVAPSLIPRKPGERIKNGGGTRRRWPDGSMPVWVPDPEHEAMRDLARARADMVDALRKARQRLMAQTFPQPAQQGPARNTWMR